MTEQFIAIAVGLTVFLAGCADSNPVSPDSAQQSDGNGGQEALPVSQPAKGASDSAVEPTHSMTRDTVYYVTSPQQAYPPDGTFAAGTKVAVVREAGSYSLVRSNDGVTGFVSADSLQPLSANSDETSGENGDSDEETPSKKDLETLVEGNNAFAWALYDQLRQQQDGNFFFSPLSLSTALAMTFAGAAGETAEEMANALRFSLDQDRLHSAFSAIQQELSTNGEKQGHQLLIANRLWGQSGAGFLPEFLEITRDAYAAELEELDFQSQTEQARLAINDWIEEQTERKIEDLIPEGALDSATRLVLTNAIYFRGDWTHPFRERATTKEPFHVSPEQTVQIPLMQQDRNFGYAEKPGLQILEMPYGNADLSMVILLPEKAGGLTDLEQELTAGKLNSSWSDGLKKHHVKVFVPRFQLSSQFQLRDALGAIGMKQAFAPQEADFSGMNGNRNLFLSAVIHKAFVDVNEKGTEAAAATAVVVATTSVRIPRFTFRADRPFVFLIRDTRSGSLLFLGRVVNPAT